MAQSRIEERVAALEREMAELKAAVANGAHHKDWRNIIGHVDHDEVWERIDEAGRTWREEDRRKARRKRSKAKKVKA